jgi:signal transduction histidine kinase
VTTLQRPPPASAGFPDGLLGAVLALVAVNARAYALSERRRQLLDAAGALSDALVPPIDLADALQEVVTRARSLAGATTCVVVQFPEGAHPVIAAAESVGGEDLATIVRPILDELRIVEDREVAVDIDLGDRWALAIPLLAHLADPGALALITDARPTYELREMLLGYVDQAGLALDRVQALTEREELAVVTERARIGRDLHDVVIQRLFAAGLKLQSLRTGADDLEQRIDDVVEDLDATIQDIRTTIFGLQNRPTASA